MLDWTWYFVGYVQDWTIKALPGDTCITEAGKFEKYFAFIEWMMVDFDGVALSKGLLHYRLNGYYHYYIVIY